MIFETQPAAAANHPWVLYATLAVAVIGIILGGADKVLVFFGKWGEKWRERLDRQRSAAAASDDADITELKRSLNNMSTMLDEERRQNAQHRVLIAELYRYILAAQMNPQNLQKQVPDPFARPISDSNLKGSGGGV